MHRARLWSRYLPEFGWQPVVVCRPKAYEEKPDPRSRASRRAGLACHPRVDAAGEPAQSGGRHRRPGILRLLQGTRELGGQPIDFVLVTIPPASWRRSGGSSIAAMGSRSASRLSGSLGEPLAWRRQALQSMHGAHTAWPACWSLGRTRGAALITGMAPGYVAGMLERNPAVAERGGRLHADGQRPRISAGARAAPAAVPVRAGRRSVP